MFRSRIIGLAVAAVVLLGGGVYLWSTMQLREWGEERVRNELNRSQRLMDRLKSLDVADLVADAKKWADSEGLHDILKARLEATGEDGDGAGEGEKKPDGGSGAGEEGGGEESLSPDAARYRIIGELAALEVRHKESYHLELILDERGRALARAKLINWDWNGKDLSEEYPASSLDASKTGKSPIVTAAMHKEPGADLWFFEESLVLTAAAPVLDGDRVLGVVVLARHLSANAADADKAMLGLEVAYLLDSEVHGTTLSSEASEDLEWALDNNKQLLASVLGEDRKATAPTPMVLKERGYLTTLAPYPGDASANRAAYALAIPVDAFSEPIDFVITPLLILGGGVLLLVIILGIVLSQGMERPVAEIEQGIIEVYSGNHDFKFRGESYLAGVAQQLNIMVATLLGKPLPDEEAEEQELRTATGEWADPLFIDEDAVKVHAGEIAVDAEVAKRLALQPEEEYLAQLFKGYTNSRSSLGQPMGGVTLEKFSKKIKNNESMLKRKYDAHMVRFQVVVKENTVILQPVPLDKEGRVAAVPDGDTA